jgi:hypothetical protein
MTLSEVIEGTTYWKLEPHFKGIPPVTFTLNELMALYYSRKLRPASGQGKHFGNKGSVKIILKTEPFLLFIL